MNLRKLHGRAGEVWKRRYTGLKFIAAFVLGTLAGCGGGGGGGSGGGGDYCVPPTLSGNPSTNATAGVQYVADLDASYTCLFIFTCDAVDIVQAPPGAGSSHDNVYWMPSSGQANATVQFQVAVADECGNRVTKSWSVRVYAPPVIESFTAASTNIKRGESAVLTAIFQGNGRIEGVESVQSGIPVTTPPLNVSTTFKLIVGNVAGYEVSQRLSVQVPSPPAIQWLGASPTLIPAGGSSKLEWRTSGDFTVARVDPLGIDVRGITSMSVSPPTTTSYTLYLADDVGATATASVQVEVVPMPAIESFQALPSSTVLGGTVSLVGRFQGTGRVDRLNDSPATLGPVTSGEAITSPPLNHYSGFRLVVTDMFGRTATRDVFVEVTGPGTFAPTIGQPSLPARRRHSATLLEDGRVFIAGGLYTDSTEIYDPIADVFTPGPRLLQARQRHSAVLLRDGRVLILGDVPTAEIFDPVTGQVSATSWDSDVGYGSAIRLPDDRVFFGWFGGGIVIDEVAASRVPIIPSNMPFAGCVFSYSGPAVSGLADGRVLTVIGEPTPSALFLPDSNSFAATGAAARNRGCGYRTSRLGDGRVLLSGGDILPGMPAEVFDPTTGTFTDVGLQQNFTRDATASSLVNGKSLLVGGSYGGQGRSPYAEVFDPGTGTFSATGGMRNARVEHTATVLQDGRVLVVGGCDQLPCEAEVYTPE